MQGQTGLTRKQQLLQCLKKPKPFDLFDWDFWLDFFGGRADFLHKEFEKFISEHFADKQKGKRIPKPEQFDSYIRGKYILPLGASNRTCVSKQLQRRRALQNELRTAIATKDIQRIKQLMNEGVHLRHTYDDNETTLMIALKTGDIEMIKFLMKEGIFYNWTQAKQTLDKLGIQDSKRTSIYDTMHEGWMMRRLKYFIQWIKSFDEKTERNHNDVGSIISIYKDILNRKDETGETPLMYAVRRIPPQTRLVVKLLSYGADIFITNNSGQTVLDFENIPDDMKRILMSEAQQERERMRQDTYNRYMNAVRSNNKQYVQKFLQAPQRNDHIDALRLAIQMGLPNIVELILKKYPDLIENPKIKVFVSVAQILVQKKT